MNTPNFCKLLKHFTVDSQHFYKPRTRFSVGITDKLTLHKPPTRIAVLKSDSPNLYNLPSCFAVLKTKQTFTSLLTRFAVGQKESPHFYKTVLTSRFSKRTIQTYRLFKTGKTTFLHASYMLTVLKTDSPNRYKRPTRVALLKTNSPYFYKPPTRFAVLKTETPHF